MMGLFSFLKKNPEAQISKAKKLVEGGEFARARHLVEGMEQEEAQATLKAALNGLRELNLQEAVALANAGEFDRAEEHLELAEQFGSTLDTPLKEARRAVREKRAAAPVKAKRVPTGGGDPFGTGGAVVPPPPSEEFQENTQATKPVETGEPNSIWDLPPDDPRLAVAMAMESYPEEIRERLLNLGTGFIGAVTLIDSGDPKAAITALSDWIEKEPAVRHERARAALNDGNLALAASDLASFGQEVGHQTIGQQHTAALLSQLLTQQGRLQEGITVLDKALKKEPKNVQLRGTLAHLLEMSGKIERADEIARSLVSDHPSDLSLYRLMARCRIRANKRVQAMQVLESGLKTNCTSGNCGAQPFDVESGRMLSQLYLEDRLDQKRAEGLLSQVKTVRKEHHWRDDYLDALVARNRGQDDLNQLVDGLLVDVPEEDPRRILVSRAFSTDNTGESAGA
jgi:tetratricopeptide (TPR) repeat protein